MAHEGMHPPALSTPSGCCQHKAVVQRHPDTVPRTLLTQSLHHHHHPTHMHVYAHLCRLLGTHTHQLPLIAGTHTVKLSVFSVVATVWFCTITTALLHCSTSTYAQCTTSTTQVIGSVYTAQATVSRTHSSSSCVAAGTQLQLSCVRRMCQEGHSDQWRPSSHLHEVCAATIPANARRGRHRS
jgi:hypothetical protein